MLLPHLCDCSCSCTVMLRQIFTACCWSSNDHSAAVKLDYSIATAADQLLLAAAAVIAHVAGCCGCTALCLLLLLLAL